MPLQSGALRQKLILESKPEGIPGSGLAGDEESPWTVVGTYRAEVRSVSGRELFQAAQLKISADYRIRMRNVGPIKPIFYRFRHGDLILRPQWVQREDEQSRFYVILASSLAAEDA
jgi:head-tail adaptor